VGAGSGAAADCAENGTDLVDGDPSSLVDRELKADAPKGLGVAEASAAVGPQSPMPIPAPAPRTPTPAALPHTSTGAATGAATELPLSTPSPDALDAAS